MLSFANGLRRGTACPRTWLLCCLGMMPIAAFSLIALWSHDRILFHWAAPGYLMLFPLLGRAIAARPAERRRAARHWLIGSAVFLVAGVFIVASEVRWNWLPGAGEHFMPGDDPDLEAVDWTSLRTELAQRGLLGGDIAAVAVTRWNDAGKLDYALGERAPVICLCSDPREYGLIDDEAPYRGRNLLIVAPRSTAAAITAELGARFATIEALPPLTLRHAGADAMVVPLFLGRDFDGPPRVGARPPSP